MHCEPPNHFIINYPSTLYATILYFLYSYGFDRLRLLIDNLSCRTSNYLTIFQCGYNTSISSSCSSPDDDVTVVCCKFCNNIKLTDNL